MKYHIHMRDILCSAPMSYLLNVFSAQKSEMIDTSSLEDDNELKCNQDLPGDLLEFDDSLSFLDPMEREFIQIMR